MSVVALTTGNAILIIIAVAIPVALLTFVIGASSALRQIGKGQFAIESDFPQRPQAGTAAPAPPHVREAEIRQMVEAKAYRRQARGEAPVDVDAEVKRLLEHDSGAGSLGKDAELREEVRQLVVARNERRLRQGKEPLDVEREIERQLRDLENLGQ